jgi:hypothetical protein
MPLDDLLDFGDLAEIIIGGWRYLLSRNYRLKKSREWREQAWIVVLFEIVLGIAGIVVSIGLLDLLLRLGMNSLKP